MLLSRKHARMRQRKQWCGHDLRAARELGAVPGRDRGVLLGIVAVGTGGRIGLGSLTVCRLGGNDWRWVPAQFNSIATTGNGDVAPVGGNEMSTIKTKAGWDESRLDLDTYL